MRWMVLLVALLAGCVDSGEVAPAADPVFDDVEVSVSDTTGAILGVVVDDAIRSVPGVKVVLALAGGSAETTTDDEGRFVFSDIPEGTWFLDLSHPLFADVQTSTDVVAGVHDPAVLKVLMERLFDQDPYVEQIKLNGFITCSYDAGITAPCITDYTSILVPGGAYPPLKDVQGDTREYTASIAPGWQSMVIEMQWEASAQGTSPAMGGVASYEGRLASHGYSRWEGVSPLRNQINVGAAGPNGDEPVPEEGLGNFLVFFGVRDGGQTVAVSVNQEFEVFHHTFYYAEAPRDWSFLAGHPLPF